MQEKEKIHYLQTISELCRAFTAVYPPAAHAKARAFSRSNGHFMCFFLVI